MPTHPWNEMNGALQFHHDLESQYQYSFDSKDLVRMVDYVGYHPDDGAFDGEGWP